MIFILLILIYQPFSTIYVDFVDSILKRSTSLDDIILLLKNPSKIKRLVNLYNKINNKLDLNGVAIMIVLKICAYNFYVLLNDNTIELFSNNMEKIEKMISIVEGNFNE